CISATAASSSFFADPAPLHIYTLSLHDALPICTVLAATPGSDLPAGGRGRGYAAAGRRALPSAGLRDWRQRRLPRPWLRPGNRRSEEHTSELQSLAYLVCRLLLEKKKPRYSITM